MSKASLSLTSLRRRRLHHEPERRDHLAQLLDSAGSLRLSRREMIAVTGATAITLSNPLRAAEQSLGRLELVEIPGPTGSPGKLIFRLGGHDCWVVDPARFGGGARLSVDRRPGRLRIQLRNAHYPGTSLPADMECELGEGLGGWTIHLRLKAGGFNASGAFEPWLAGKRTLHSNVVWSNVTWSDAICALRSGSQIGLHGAGVAELSPDWTLHAHGGGLARVSGLGEDLLSDAVVISLLPPKGPSLLNRPDERRTLIALARGDRSWRLEPALRLEYGSSLVPRGEPFDVLYVEAGESAAGSARRAMVAEGDRADPAFLFSPYGMVGSDRLPVWMPLKNVRYAVAFNGESAQASFMAWFGSEPVWVHTAGCSLLLGNSPDRPVLELVGAYGGPAKVRCEPGLIQAAAPVAGAVVEPMKVPYGSRMAFVRRGDETPLRLAARAAGTVSIPGSSAPAMVVPNGVIQRISLPSDTEVQLPASAWMEFFRPDDMLSLEFKFYNLALTSGVGQPAQLNRVIANQPAYIVAEFPCQNITEEAYPEDTTEAQHPLQLKSPPRTRLAGSSRIALIVPSDVNSIPYTLEALLDWTQFQMNVAPTALPAASMAQVPWHIQRSTVPPLRLGARPKPGEPLLLADRLSTIATPAPQFGPATPPKPPKIANPLPYETALEMPWRLILSPNEYGGWAHSLTPVQDATSGRVELWHTRLGVRNNGAIDESDDIFRTVRAIWSPDYATDRAKAPKDTDPRDKPFLTDMNPYFRDQIVDRSSNFTGGNKPEPIQVQRLMLTALGGWIDVRGFWPEEHQGVTEWKHRGTLGRDHYVRVQEAGFLFPFGHQASMVTLTEREFHNEQPGNPAILRQKIFLIVKEPTKAYAGNTDSLGRQMPFKTVTITTETTPPLGTGTYEGKPYFFAQLAPNQPFYFHLIGTDIRGRTTEFTAPLIFVLADHAWDPSDTSDLGHAKKEYDGSAWRKRGMSGKKISYADSKKPGDTELDTVSVSFTANLLEGTNPAQNESKNQPAFVPGFKDADVEHPALKHLLANSVGPTPGTTNVKFNSTYLNVGFDGNQNRGELFLEMTSHLPLTFPADKAGGPVTPDMQIKALSRQLGPVGSNNAPKGVSQSGGGGDAEAIAKALKGTFDPKQFFQDAKMLGGLLLSDLVQGVSDFMAAGSGGKAPTIKTDTSDPNKWVTTFAWNPDAQSDPTGLFIPDPNCKLDLNAALTTPLDGTKSTYNITGKLDGFTLKMLPGAEMIDVKFNAFTFQSATGQKMTVNPDIASTTFVGALSFVNSLEQFLKGAGFNIDVTPTQVSAGYTLNIPSIGVGILSLENLGFTVGITIPFLGDQKTTFDFAFCSRENPFLLTVWIFGGGGFFHLTLNADGLQMIEASFEFGGNLSLDIGVASGGVSIMAGIYYKGQNVDASDPANIFKPNPRSYTETTLEGFLRCSGELSILDIITISVEFYLVLHYQGPPPSAYGEASVSVKIEILFFSISVELSVRKQFEGSGSSGSSSSASSGFAELGGEKHDRELALRAASAPVNLDPVFTDMITPADWTDYCSAFAPLP